MKIKHMMKEQVTEALKQNMAGKFTYLASLNKMMSVTQSELRQIDSDCHSDMFNIICDSKTSDLTLLKHAFDLFTHKNLPFSRTTV